MKRKPPQTEKASTTPPKKKRPPRDAWWLIRARGLTCVENKCLTYDSCLFRAACFFLWRCVAISKVFLNIVLDLADGGWRLACFFDWAFARLERAQAIGGDDAVWVMPRLRLHRNPSAEFTQLVRLHGIGLVGAAAGGHRRMWHSKTFHSLRATVATMLQVSGVSQGLAMELVGHESAAVHSVYIRPSQQQLREAAAVLPEL